MRFDFLMCSERSGSNLMTKIMNAHPEVCGPFPSHLMRNVLLNYYRYGDLQIDANWDALTEDVAFYMERIFAVWKTTASLHDLRNLSTERTFAQLTRKIYETEARAHGKSRVFVKENQSYLMAPYILSHFPDAKYVLVVRDPRDMAQRWKQTARSGGVGTGAKQWKTDQSASLRLYSQLRDIGRMIFVRFEDLVVRGEEEARRICEFLDLRFDEKMLRFYEQDLVGENAGRIPEWEDLGKPLMPQSRTRLLRPSETNPSICDLDVP